MQLDLPDPAATDALGAALAPHIQPGMVIFLSGGLGAGKTALARAMLRALGFPGRVKSPTYTLVELYPVSRLNLYHFDFYRFNDPREWADAGFREIFDGRNVCVVEWPEKAAGQVPAADLEIELTPSGDGRLAQLKGNSEQGRACLEQLYKHYGLPPHAPESVA